MLLTAARGLLAHAFPILIAQLSSIGMMVVDTAVLGHVSAADLAAVAVGGGIQISVVFALVGILQAVAPVVAQLHGAKRDGEVAGVLQQGFWLALALAVIVWVSTREALAGRLNAGQFMGLMISMTAIIPSLRRLTSVQSSISRGVSAAERLFDILDMPVERDEGRNTVQRVRGELAFEHVTFAYDGTGNARSGMGIDTADAARMPEGATIYRDPHAGGYAWSIWTGDDCQSGGIGLDAAAYDWYGQADLDADERRRAVEQALTAAGYEVAE